MTLDGLISHAGHDTETRLWIICPRVKFGCQLPWAKSHGRFLPSLTEDTVKRLPGTACGLESTDAGWRAQHSPHYAVNLACTCTDNKVCGLSVSYLVVAWTTELLE